MFFHIQKGKAVMRNILGPIYIAMFVASCGGGAGTNPFDNPADSNTATTDETSNNNMGKTDNTDGSDNTDTSENTVTSISFDGATPPDGNSVVNVTSENNSIIRTFGGVGDVRYAVENGNEVLYIDNLGFDGNAGDPHTKVTNFGGFGTQDVYAEGAGVITFTSQDPTQFMNSQKGAYDGEIDQYEEAGGFILDRNLP